MAISIRPVTLWRSEVENRPGVLASTLEHLARSGANLQVVMAYRYPGNESRAAIEVHPVAGKKPTAAAQAAGLTASGIPTLRLEGPDRPGLGYATSKAITDAGVNIAFFVTQVIGNRYSTVIGFDSEADARKAAAAVRKALAARSAGKTKPAQKKR